MSCRLIRKRANRLYLLLHFMRTARFVRTSGMRGMAGGLRLPDLQPVISEPLISETVREASPVTSGSGDSGRPPHSEKKVCDQAFPK
jgi:hypothetical protein